jgi:nucleoside-diphosphate-sugar epimerase
MILILSKKSWLSNAYCSNFPNQKYVFWDGGTNLDQLFKQFSFETTINFIGKRSGSIFQIFYSNFILPIKILNLCRKYNSRYISFGTSGEYIYTNFFRNPRMLKLYTHYSFSKYLDFLHIKFCLLLNQRVLRVRLHNVFGENPNQFTGLGDIKFQLLKASQKNTPFTLNNFNIKRHYLDIVDVVSKLNTLIFQEKNGLFEFTTEKNILLHDIVMSMGDLSSVSISLGSSQDKFEFDFEGDHSCTKILLPLNDAFVIAKKVMSDG